MAASRVKCDNSDLKAAVEDLRNSGYTNAKISDEIGTRIDSCLYRDHKMSLESFEKLLEIADREINHELVSDDRYGSKEIANFTKNGDLAELCGLILGDGHIQYRSRRNNSRNTSTYFVSITLNKDEEEIIENSGNLLEEVTGLEAKTYKKQGNCVRIVIHSKDAVEKFQEIGLEPGHKTEKQVSIPNWIKKSEKFCRRCVKGLIDTDGSIYNDKRKNRCYKRIIFKNYSEPLLEDFREMCLTLNIKTVDGGPHQVQVSMKDIDKFIKTVNPIKAHTS
ncbi:LAGLIDADG family homing endonuclease [Candidatus Nanohalobium constans]|uniref:Intein/homing endonuclease n=1 Tax=Candidatus Nanohalobium constans TaxID=2565781 RepID=A0A5Q0UES3_9ARCH|nr:LAGLIDADG family homing endonuclease [Candidatus Nanohalobium constans]QGA80083.1 intein/homing endonuclease [Candidatus Nanohalobium constans]